MGHYLYRVLSMCTFLLSPVFLDIFQPNGLLLNRQKTMQKINGWNEFASLLKNELKLWWLELTYLTMAVACLENVSSVFDVATKMENGFTTEEVALILQLSSVFLGVCW